MSRIGIDRLLAVSPARPPAVVTRALELDAQAAAFEREAQRARVDRRELAAEGFEGRAREARREVLHVLGVRQ